ncbi:MAG: hypothetical protein HQ568_05875 [Calditrichaeota bacterium]|nr:hypothetical protein [Calditrichota bacterium]
MAKKSVSRSPGSLILEILVAILIVVLILTILTPKRKWEDQVDEESFCRQKMENTYFAARFYHKNTGNYSSNLTEILHFAETESITVNPPGFKMDRLTRSDSGIDSFQIEYFDPYGMFNHYQREINFFFPNESKRDSLILEILPKPEYPFAPVTRYYFTSDVPINVRTSDRGVKGCFTLVGAQGKLNGVQVLGETVSVPAAEYIYNIDKSDVDKCPTTNTQFKTELNIKLRIFAEMKAVISNDTSMKLLSDSYLLSSIVVFRMLKKADAHAKRELLINKVFEKIEDSLITIRNNAFLDSIAAELRSGGASDLAIAIYDSALDEHPLGDQEQAKHWDKIRDSSYELMNKLKTDSTIVEMINNIVNERNAILLTEKFAAELERIEAEGQIKVTERSFINTILDSIEFYSNPDLIASTLFKAHNDSITKAKVNCSRVADLLAKFHYTESYIVEKTDTTGLTIECPIEGVYRKPDLPLLNRIFSVEGAKNHGMVKNGDLSWSDKR